MFINKVLQGFLNLFLMTTDVCHLFAEYLLVLENNV